MTAEPVRLEIYRTAIPMRGFEHAAAARDVAEAVVVRMDFSDGRAGWGETLPRQYVTGETIESVVRDLAEVIWPSCRDSGVAGEIVPAFCDAGQPGRCMSAALCAYDLANLRRVFERVEDIAPAVLERIGGGCGVRGRISARVSGVLGSADPKATARRLRVMRWFGLRDFKLKLGLSGEADAENLRVVDRQIGKAIARGKCTLRVDVNGGWREDETPRRVAGLKQYGVCVVEQPAYCSARRLAELARACEVPLMADESLLTQEDARVLLEEPTRVWWNIRLSKNGGLVRSLLLARLAADHAVEFTLGCMVGESGILSAAQRRALQLGPQPRFVEGNYGRFLLADDLTERSPRLGYGGRLRPLKGDGLGIAVDPGKLKRYAQPVMKLER